MRQEIRQYFSNFAVDGSLNAIEVIVGELLANVVRHANSSATIHVAWQDDAPTLTVVDSGPGYTAAAIPMPAFEDDSGYGLWLVQSLGDDVRITRGPRGGTTVSVRLPYD
jgi:anti-sigma regulatory factor (Ser/Thr protein kinase)